MSDLDDYADNAEDGVVLSAGGRSVNVLLGMKKARQGDTSDPVDSDEEIDPCLFDEDYSVAARTGFGVWGGTWALASYLFDSPKSNDPASPMISVQVGAGGESQEVMELYAGPEYHPAPAVSGKRVIELGSGVGALGLLAAHHGAHALLTDVSSVVDDILTNNIARNASTQTSIEAKQAFSRGLAVGKGSAAAMTIDWTKPLPNDTDLSCDMLLAAETVWLKELVQPFCQTCANLLRLQPRSVPLYMCYRDRGTATSRCFAIEKDVVDAFRELGCNLEVVLREQCSSEAGGDVDIRGPKTCSIFRITLKHISSTDPL